VSNEDAQRIAEMVADKVAAALRALASDRHPLAISPGQEWANAAQLAHRYGFMDPETIRKRPVQFGAAPLDGPGSAVRYHVPTADAYWRVQQQKLAEAHRPAVAPRAGRARKRRPTKVTRSGVPLVEF
jgi:hypothetical protein